MNKYAQIFEYLRQCPEMQNLWSIAATEDVGVRVVLPIGTSQSVQYRDFIDSAGNYNCECIPYPSVYDDFQVNCYEWYDVKDSSSPSNNENVLSIDNVLKVCEWIEEQNDLGNFPDINEKVVSIECISDPQIRYINEEENTIAYFITIRIRYVNKKQRKFVYYEC